MVGFPIFVDVSKRAPLVVGGGTLAAIKARLLLKRAEKVEFASIQTCADVLRFVEEGRASILARPAVEDDIKGRPLVISASEDGAEDTRIFEIAKSLGVPVNVPDRPELCTFSLAAIVDRAPVTLAIGTEGTAPVLATQIRASLERDLHPRLGRLAEIAGEFRDKVASALPRGAARRKFWDAVFLGDVSSDVFFGREDDARSKLNAALVGHENVSDELQSAAKAFGRVFLVGAGPGDAELLTLKAVRALKSADVILTDFLVGDGVLEHARREAEIVHVGKKPGRHSRTQAEINTMIVAYAREGLDVVRLKGGDPFIFGRGGEEIDTLRASGIECEVIPGVTAATAAAASLQIPLTHRDLARSVTFVSGHSAGDGRPDFSHLNFAALASGQATIVAYMAVANAGALGCALLEAGWVSATPVMAVERASQESERRVQTTLDVLADDASRLSLKGPALLICGEVAGLTPDGFVEQVRAVMPEGFVDGGERADV